MSGTLALSRRHAMAEADAVRQQIATALEALHAPGRATPETTGFFFIAIGSVAFSVAMLKRTSFGRLTAYLGLMAGLLTVIDDACIIVAPALAAILMPISGLAWVLWWLLVSRALFRLSRSSTT